MSTGGDCTEFGCQHCFGDDPQAAWEHELRRVHTLIDKSHFDILVLQCPECGQHFVRIFTEFVDWRDSEDSMYWDRIPVTESEAQELAQRGRNVEFEYIQCLAEGRRRLHRSYPTTGRITVGWTRGPLWIMEGR